MAKKHPEPQRPQGLPPEATWNEDENEWEVGTKSPDGKFQGDWIWWYPDGTVICRATHDEEGRLHGYFERFHPNGERSQWAVWRHGKVHGLNSWTRPTSGKADTASVLPPNLGDHVMRMDLPYDQGRPQAYHFTLYTLEGIDSPVPHDSDGRSIDLGEHLSRVAAETTFFLLEPYFRDVEGNHIENTEEDDVRWIYDGPTSNGYFGVRRQQGYNTKIFEVSKAEMSRAFTLSSDYYLASLEAKRPASVPENAIWNLEDEVWECGKTEDKVKMGRWDLWDKEGKPIGHDTFSKYGVLHGERARLASDGTAYLHEVYYKGDIEKALYIRTGATTKFFEDVAESIDRIEMELYDGVLLSKFFADGIQVNHLGVAVSEAFCDSDFDFSPEEFLEKRFAIYLGTNASSIVPQGLAHDSLQGLARRLNEPPRHLVEWTLEDVLTSALAEEEPGNTERVIERLKYFRADVLWDTRQTDAWELFCGFAPFGRKPWPASTYFVDATGLDTGVWIFSGAHRLATSVESFIYAQCALDAYKQKGSLSPEAFRRAMKSVEDSVFALGPFEGFIPDSYSSRRQLHNKHPYVERGEWIIKALAGQLQPSDIVVWPEVPSLEQLKSICESSLVDASYWLFRLFFTSSDLTEPLAEHLKTAQSWLIRDVAGFIDEILWGREFIGPVEDIYEYRGRLQAQGILPGSYDVQPLDEEEDTQDHKSPTSFAPVLSRLGWPYNFTQFWTAAHRAHLATPEEKLRAIESLQPLSLGPARMPVVRFALKSLGAEVDDVRLWVRTALAPETNPESARDGEEQTIWALRVAGEDDSVEAEVILEWVHHAHTPIRDAARLAASKKNPETIFEPLPDISTLDADTLGLALKDWVAAWKPYAKNIEPSKLLRDGLERLISLSDTENTQEVVSTLKAFLESNEPAFKELAMSFPIPNHPELVEPMRKVEETATGWVARLARHYLYNNNQADIA
ncbi:hypothetical protein FRD01_17070 [Microvenator marinus]|uniref:Uncharacterized protein n=1 Tax=Microvenator marinus TaxID=2600177 RepID=A0A5B8XTB5_9DELT|nr:hypothetical protein [Microvenator marinus]QED28920.1 hypothetical protein FRD01_17070 [Microvenator marinus]